MTIRAIRNVVMSGALFFSIVTLVTAQEKQIKKVPVKAYNPTSGAEMFKAYCAVCHGRDGKGDGPTAPALTERPANLTTLAQRHDGKFPDAYVSNVLRNGVKKSAHGSAEMPIWGPLFQTMNRQDDAKITLRITNLTNYIRSLQAK